MKMKIFGKHIISVWMLVLLLVSCVDDEFYTDGPISEGETELAATIGFSTFAPALETRTAGDAIKNINSLWLMIYEKDENDSWTLEEGGKIRITAEEHHLTTSLADNTRPDGKEQSETETGHASFRFRHKNGQYKVYAVANCDLDTLDSKYIDTPEKLKSLQLRWDEDKILNNSEMFGCFTNDKSVAGSGDETVIISPNRTIHAWIRRAASKVTVAYDGSRLADGVTIYLMSVTIKDIPRHCLLGMDNTEPDSLINGEMIKYYDEQEGPLPSDPNFISEYKAIVTNQTPVDKSVHEDTAPALFFYENMQGIHPDKDKRQKDTDKDGTLDYTFKDGVNRGTFIEVQAIYRSTNSERPGYGIIKYRFMLGKDIYTDYNAERNHHYKLTLKFNKFANDVDWHIDYKDQAFDITQPEVYDFDYMGNVFEPDHSRPNLGHNFNKWSTFIVTNIEDDEGIMENIQIQYRDLTKGETEFSDYCDWLDYTITPGDHPYEKKVNFYIKDGFLKPDEEIDINDKLKNALPKGSKEAPYNLAHPNGTPGIIVCSSNCYMVDAPGWYIFPLVYGNAVHNGVDNKSSYTYTGDTGNQILSVFRNHLDNPITSPYIQKNEGCNPQYAYLVWQDVQDLLRPAFTWDWDPNEIAKAPTYIPDVYNVSIDGVNTKIGGIRFYVEPGKIKQGNAMIAVSDRKPTVIDANTGKFELPPAIWSWHIWITRFDFDDSDKTIEVTAHDANRKFEFMPVNLGWCSEDGEKIKYYKAHRCEVQFNVGGKSVTVTLEKKSHISFTRGNNPYYQWGRKDPFIAAKGNLFANKPRWTYLGWEDTNNPPLLTDYNSEDRPTTREALGQLIQHPDTWHNPPRLWTQVDATTDTWQYVSKNETYSNLWEGRPGTDPLAQTLKTIYDPCPIGYQVSHYNAFTGFTTTGDNTNYSPEWYNVLLKNIAGYDETTQSCGIYSDYLLELYTNPQKNQSIIFPQTGYRDWDDKVNTYHFGNIGYIWAAGNVKNDDNNSYNFEFSRTDGEGYIRPKNTFYPCDGFPVRPVRNGTHGLDTP